MPSPRVPASLAYRRVEATSHPANTRGASVAARQPSFPHEGETPPPPSRRLRSHSSRVTSASAAAGLSAATAQPLFHTRPVPQRRPAPWVGDSRVGTGAVAPAVAPQSSRTLTAAERRAGREPFADGGGGSATPVSLLQPRNAKLQGGAASARLAPAAVPFSVGPQPALRSAAAAHASTSASPPQVLRPQRGSGGLAGAVVVPLFSRSRSPSSGSDDLERDAGAGAEVEERAATCTAAPAPGDGAFPSSCGSPPTRSAPQSAAPGCEAAPRVNLTPTSAAAHPSASAPVLGLNLPGIGGGSGQLGTPEQQSHLSSSHVFARSAQQHHAPMPTSAGLLSPSMPSVSAPRRSTPSVPSLTGASHCSTLTDPSLTPHTGSCLTCSPAVSALDLPQCAAPASQSWSLAEELRRHCTPPPVALDAFDAVSTASMPPSRTHTCSTPHASQTALSAQLSNPTTAADGPTAAAASQAREAVTEPATFHAPEQHRAGPVAPHIGPATRSTIASQRVAPPARPPPATREAVAPGAPAKAASGSREGRTAATPSPVPTRPPRANASTTPRRVSTSSDRRLAASGVGASPVPVSSGASTTTRSPNSVLSTEAAKRVLKERRRRELYAWNEQLRMQNEAGVQDAV